MKRLIKLFFLSLLVLSCRGQTQPENERTVGGPCEGCEAVLDYQLLDITPKTVDTIPGFHQNDPKIKIGGTVFHGDGKSPAANVLIYIYHVNRKGIYQPGDNPVGWERRHGQHRVWLKTGSDGKFTFYTFQPSAYPDAREPQHIHIYIKEPNTIPYYLDSYHFESDGSLTEKVRNSLDDRGGSGIVKLEMEDGIWTARRDIILGLNIPDY